MTEKQKKLFDLRLKMVINPYDTVFCTCIDLLIWLWYIFTENWLSCWVDVVDVGKSFGVVMS